MLRSAYWYDRDVVAFADVPKHQTSCNATFGATNDNADCHLNILKQEDWIRANYPTLTHVQARLEIKHKANWSRDKTLCVENLGCVSVFSHCADTWHLNLSHQFSRSLTVNSGYSIVTTAHWGFQT